MECFNISCFGKLLAAIMISMVITKIVSLEITDRLDYSSNGLIGTHASFGCDWVRSNSDYGLALKLITQSEKIYLYYLPIEFVVIKGPHFHSRLVVTNTSTALRMTIMNISCLDIDTYICRMVYRSNSNLMEKYSTGRLVDITIPPQVPVMTQPPLLVVSEGSTVTYKCLAKLGRPKKGQFVWNAYVNDEKVKLTLTPIVKETSNDNNCTGNVESTVTFQANRTNLNITLACFSTNQDFQQTAPSLCTNTVTDLCAQSQPLNILYAASNLKVNRNPQSDVDEGSTMTLTCQADGNPQPTYRWRQVGNENRSLNGVQEGLTNKLILSNTSVTYDTGIYNCTANNNVRGVNYSITGQVSINVFPKPTTTTTTTTTWKISPTFLSSQATGPETADAPGETNSTAIAVGVPLGLVLTAIITGVIIVLIKRNRTAPYVNIEFHAHETANIKHISSNEVTSTFPCQRVDKPSDSIYQGEQEYHVYDEYIEYT